MASEVSRFVTARHEPILPVPAVPANGGVAVPSAAQRAELDKAYVPTRYPNAHPAGAPRTRYTRAEAERLIGDADEILRFCAGLLPPA